MTVRMTPIVVRYWCPMCGIVRDDLLRPICRHGVPDPTHPPRRMTEIPSYHPLASERP